MQDCVSSNKIKENKYKILRMSLLLGRGEDQEETLTNFEEAARDIDTMNDEIYLKDLEGKFYDTLTLEEEEKKLSVLVDYIGGRVEQRISLLNDFSNVTGYDLNNLPPIKYYDKLDDFKERLKYIREYLNNIAEIKILEKKISDAEKNLKEAYLNRATAEDYNARNEEIILNKFENLLKSTILKDVNLSNINDKLETISRMSLESKKSLDIFNKSFATLSGSGISLEEEQEYKSYVENAKEVYYSNKEQEYLVKIYKYLLKSEVDYNAIIEKREAINNLIYERMTLRKELNVKEADILSNLYDLLDRQYEDIKHQKDNIEVIDDLTENIEKYKEDLNELEVDNQKVEILALLREFCLIDTYNEEISKINNINTINTTTTNNVSFQQDTSEQSVIENNDKTTEIDISKPEEKQNEPADEEFIKKEDFSPLLSDEKISNDVAQILETVKDNQIVSVEDATNIDLEYIHAKASKVMQRVGEMLGIKTKETKVVSFEEPKPAKSPLQEEKIKEEQKVSNNTENPLFGANMESKIENPEKNSKDQFTLPENNNLNNNFWFSSDTPDALNELPDLEITDQSKNTNSNIPNLNFPDLNLNFAPNNEKEDAK